MSTDNNKTNETHKDFSLISKLMATENINVRFDYVQTAYFDLTNRDLVLPILRDLTDDVYKMMSAHEISHALHTPQGEWNTLIGTDNIKKQYANILEDARIERLIKRRYPGVVREMKAGYDILHEKGFFGVEEGEDLSERPLIDRINLHFKSYGNLNVPFTKEEIEWVRRAGNTETFEDVARLTEELYREESEKNSESSDSDETEEPENGEGIETESAGDESGDSNDSDDSGDDSADDSEGDESEGDTDGGDTEEASENDQDMKLGKGNSGDDSENDETEESSAESTEEGDEEVQNENASEGVDDDGNMGRAPEADSQKNFEEKLKDSADTNENRGHLAHITLRCDQLDKIWKDTIVPSKDFLAHYRNEINHENRYYRYRNVNEEVVVSYYKKLSKRNSKVVNNMLKEFDMKKAAAEHKRTMTSKTGAIDMDKLHNYKTSDDIFLRNETLPEGKNHGVVMYVDFSGSMSGENMMNSLSQIFNMAMFASKAGIPYRVFAFTNSWPERGDFAYYGKDPFAIKGATYDSMYYTGDFRIVEILSSELKKKDWLLAMGLIAGSVLAYDRNRDTNYYNFVDGILGGTPLNGALYVAPYIVNDFLKNYRVDKAIFMIYTDGGAGDTFRTVRMKDRRDYYDSEVTKTATLLDGRGAENFIEPKTRTVINASKVDAPRWDNLQAVLMERIRLLTSAKVMGFDIYHKKDTNSVIRNYYNLKKGYGIHDYIDYNSEEAKKIAASYKDNGYFHITNVFGYDSFTVVASSTATEEVSIDSEIKGDAESASTRAIAGAFMRANRKTNDSRYLTKKLMEVIG